MPRVEPKPENYLMRTTEVAKFFGVTVPTIRKWIEDGEIKATRVAGFHRIWRSDVIKLAQEKYGYEGPLEP